MKISIITVTFNSGEKLIKTINSVLSQTFNNIEIIIKDGLSKDKSLECLPIDSRIKIYSTKDAGIYDAMNQAVKYASGDFYLFLNCGDTLYKQDVLERVNKIITRDHGKAEIYYGDVFVATRGSVIKAPDVLDDFTLITRTICHQCIFFSKYVFEKYTYNFKEFGLAADMGLYIQCLKESKMKAKYMPFIVTNYEGNGASETIKAKKQIVQSKKKIMKAFYSSKQYKKVVLKKIIMLKYLKEWISYSKLFYRGYEKIASFVNKIETGAYKLD